MEWVEEYVRTRVRQPWMVGWVAGSLTLLAVGLSTSPGRALSKLNPPPKMRRAVVPAKLRDPMLERACVRRSNLQKVLFLFRVAIPSVRSKECAIVGVMTLLMLLRTAVNVALAKLTGRIVCSVIKGSPSGVFRSALLYSLASIPASFVTQSIEYFGEALRLRLRENVTRYIDKRYLAPSVFFRMAGLHLVDHVDQRITRDVDRFANEAAHLLYAVADPLCEALTFTVVMAQRTGWRAPAFLWAYLTGFIGIVVAFAPNLDWMAIKLAEAEADYSAAHQEIISHAEEVCMTRGYPFSLAHLARFNQAIRVRAWADSYDVAVYNVIETAYTKYGSWIVGSLIIGCALYGERAHTDPRMASTEDRTGRFAETAYVCEVLARAIGRVYWNIKHAILLNGFSQRLYQLVESLELAEYQTKQQRTLMAHSHDDADVNAVDGVNTTHAWGTVTQGEHIEFVDVPLMLPNGEVLCPSLSFYVKPGMNLLIMGPNGCGKSSTFRLLGELWPLRGGRLVKPEQDQMYYVPQRPYMYDGTLFEQVIYPLKRRDVSVGEAELYGYLEMAGLGYILSRPKVSWDARLSWSGDFLSVGEKQRLAMARLFFHRPRFAILDECSSSVDLDVEEMLYDRCRDLGISVITIAHRRSVWRYHSHILHFDGNGGYAFSALRFEDGGATLVLPHVISASDSDVVGTEMKIHVHSRGCEPGKESSVSHTDVITSTA